MNAIPLPQRRIATYDRVSSEDQKQRETIKTQTDEIARRLALNPEVELISRYTDDGISGTISAPPSRKFVFRSCETPRTATSKPNPRKMKGPGLPIFVPFIASPKYESRTGHEMPQNTAYVIYLPSGNRFSDDGSPAKSGPRSGTVIGRARRGRPLVPYL